MLQAHPGAPWAIRTGLLSPSCSGLGRVCLSEANTVAGGNEMCQRADSLSPSGGDSSP